MSFNDQIEFLKDVNTVPDTAEMPGRRAVCDGINPNIVLGRSVNDARVMGCYPQEDDLGAAEATGEGALTPGSTYVYGIQRAIYANGVKLVDSAVLTDTVELEQAYDDYRLTCGTVSPGDSLETPDILWRRIADGHFLITVGGTEYTITGLDFTGNTTWTSIAAEIEAAIQDKGGAAATVSVEYDSVNSRIVFSSDEHEINFLADDPGCSPNAETGEYDLATNMDCPDDNLARIVGGDTGAAAAWSHFKWDSAYENPLTEGSFKITLGTTEYEITGIDFDACADHAEGAAAVQTAMRAADDIFANVTVTYQPGGETLFEMLGIPTRLGAVGLLETAATGQDISGETASPWGDFYLDMGVTYAADHGSDSREDPNEDTPYTEETDTDGDEQYTLLSGTSAAGAQQISPTGTTPKIELTLENYQYPPGVDAAWEVRYRIYRSKPGNATLLYFLEELTQVQYNALDSGLYTDTTADDDLDSADTINLEDSLQNLIVPASRYCAAWRGRFIFAGGAVYRRGTVSEHNDTDELKIDDGSDGEMGKHDAGSKLVITGEEGEYVIDSVELSGGDPDYYVLTEDLANAPSEESYAMWRDLDMVYVTDPLPGNIEGYTVGGSIETVSGEGNTVTGLQVIDGAAYIHREGRIDTLEGAPGSWQTHELPNGPRGTVSHATISGPFFYAGKAGVYELRGQQAREISGPIGRYLRGDAQLGIGAVDHDYDDRAHAVYDPDRALYHLWLFRDGDAGSDPYCRLPSVMLTYDIRKQEWYAGELAAGCSGLWRDSAGNFYPVIGIVGGVAALEAGDCDGVNVPGVVGDNSGSTTLVSAEQAPEFLEAHVGLPVVVTGSDGGTQWRIIKSVTDSNTLEVYNAWESNPSSGDTFCVGAVRWSGTVPELGVVDGLERTAKLVRVAVGFEQDDGANDLTVSVTARRSGSSSEKTRTKDMNGTEWLNWRKPGIRGSSFTLSMSGAGTRPVRILGAVLEREDTDSD